MVLWYYSSYDSADLVVHGSYKSSGVNWLQWKICYSKRTNLIFIALYILCIFSWEVSQFRRLFIISS